VKYLFEVVVSAWMFATPVLYPFDGIGGTLGVLLHLNPMTPIIDSYRAVLLFDAPPAALGPVAGIASIVLAIAWLSFHRLEFQFAENI
jgi:ABC-type polysaccharide/polyol phosphate export permease